LAQLVDRPMNSICDEMFSIHRVSSARRFPSLMRENPGGEFPCLEGEVRERLATPVGAPAEPRRTIALAGTGGVLSVQIVRSCDEFKPLTSYRRKRRELRGGSSPSFILSASSVTSCKMVWFWLGSVALGNIRVKLRVDGAGGPRQRTHLFDSAGSLDYQKLVIF
jgi:hypothetical protein